MIHLTEEQLILHYYGEETDTLALEQHLDACEACRGLYTSLQRVLNVVDTLPIPVRGPEYGGAVWKRIESQLPARRRFLSFDLPWRWVAATAAVAMLLVTAFLAGRFYPQPVLRPAHMAAADQHAGDRVLLVAVGDYLERSQMMLVELANIDPSGTVDISTERERASDLISESRLYRQTATHAGEDGVASVLDDVESVLLEIAHSPSKISPERLDLIRQRLRAEGILFKIRVLGSNVRDREAADTPAASSSKKL